jgi:hypothetical protein
MVATGLTECVRSDDLTTYSHQQARRPEPPLGKPLM